MIRAALFLLAVAPLSGQTAAGVLARLAGVTWEASPTAACTTHTPVQIDYHATDEWTHHCSDTRDGIIRESFYYVFGEPARAARLRMDLRPVDESPENTARLLPALQHALTARLGAPTHEPELMEIGFRHLRYGQPVNGDHWHGGGLHYFLHSNQTNPTPMGMRKGVQLTVMTDRLFTERTVQDALILRTEGIFSEPLEGDDPVAARLKARMGTPYARTMALNFSTTPDRPRAVKQTIQDLTAILDEVDRGGRPRRALALVAADQVANKLSLWLLDPKPGGGEVEAPTAPAVRRLLSRYGVRLGGMGHYGGLMYQHELLWRAWRELPETEGGELAFLQLQARGWNTDAGVGCPANPDLFRDVIDRGEAFLASRPQTDFRKQVLYALAVANESWWSISHSPAGDGWVSGIPYPRRAANARQAAHAREEAIRYYREVIQLAPDSPEAASALRRLPRLELGLDTGQRRFFCSYC